MTTHGGSGLGRLFFGSVAEAVLRRTEVPVLLVRATTAERAKRAA
jgi:nucleotide-binding universal stress UspA family protein